MNVTNPKKNKNDEDTMAGVYNAWSKLVVGLLNNFFYMAFNQVIPA